MIPAFVLASCQYEDGPKFSLRSKKARVINTWYIDKLYQDGNDKTDMYKGIFVNYKLEFKSDDTYTLYYKLYNAVDYNENGTWKFSDDKSKVQWTPSGSSSSSDFKILRLKNDEMWGITTFDNKEVEVHLKD